MKGNDDMYCWKCGAEIGNDSRFCATCGAAVQHVAARAETKAGLSGAEQDPRLEGEHVAAGLSNDSSQGTQHHVPGMLPDRFHAPTLYAGFWRRVAAFIIDCLVLLIPYAVLTALDRQHPLVAVLQTLLLWLYFAAFESSKLQATPGKLAIGLFVTDACGRRIGFGRATGRYLCRVLSFLILLVGYFMSGWTKHKQCLHDMIADTYVIRKAGLASNAIGRDRPYNNQLKPAWISVVVGVTCFAVFFRISHRRQPPLPRLLG